MAADASPPSPLHPGAAGVRSQKSNSGGPSNFPPHVHCPFDGSPNPSRSCMSRSNPPALARGTASGRTRGRHMAPTHSVGHPGPIRGPGKERGVGWARELATRGAEPAARARWRVMRSARVASRATAGACGLRCAGASGAHVARACSALIIVARECYLIVANAILIYKKGTERSKTVPNTLITMFADLAPRAAFGATGCGRPDVATFDAHDGYWASISISTTTAGEDAVTRLAIRT